MSAMTMAARPAGWHGDPYRRHELRFWDGRAWTAQVSDLGVPADDPVFPVPEGDAARYLAPRGRRTAPSGLAATWGAGGPLAGAAAVGVRPLCRGVVRRLARGGGCRGCRSGGGGHHTFVIP